MKLQPGWVRRSVLRLILLIIVPIMLVGSIFMILVGRSLDEQAELWSDWWGTFRNGFV